MEQIPFTVDSALLRELGERLVGKPYIALAELIKNSYDADATRVVIRFLEDRIEVEDNGHGMTEQEFEGFWMRVGSPHKERQRVSRYLGRPLTGSKGIGRLAVQFLAGETELRTAAREKPDEEILALVDWSEAVEAGELTEAFAYWVKQMRETSFLKDSAHGTHLLLSELKQEWQPSDFEALAREIWVLQPPFQASAGRTDEQSTFFVELESPEDEVRERFAFQMRAFMGLWDARVTGRLLPAAEGSVDRPVIIRLEFDSGEVIEQEYVVEGCPIDRVSFEFRVYKWQGKQKHGIKVQDARDYFNEFGGIYVYDAGFRLPYYGPSHDWLDIERDHSHRLSASKLLPDELQVPQGLNFLPTTSRFFGVVNIDTNHERRAAEERARARRRRGARQDAEEPFLRIQVTRDRLADNEANRKLREILRWAVDFYAMQEAKRRLRVMESHRPSEPVEAKFRRVEEVLDHFRDSMAKPAFSRLKESAREAVEASETQAEVVAHRLALLAPLATAGMSALAYEHEAAKQLHWLERTADELEKLEVDRAATQSSLDQIASGLRQWVERAKATRKLFQHLLEEETRDARGRFRLKALLESVRDQVAVLTRGMEIDLSSVEEDVRLPPGNYIEWNALFQNVLFNASNALMDSDEKKVVVTTEEDGSRRSVRVQDTGSGVELEDAEELFQPFVRRQEISRERRSLGVGGSGLGLTIVRLIAENTGCRVRFVEPDDDFSTAFELSWKET